MRAREREPEKKEPENPGLSKKKSFSRNINESTQQDEESVQNLNKSGLEHLLSIWIKGRFIHILDSSNQSHFELASSVLALEATEPVSELVTQMVVELINNGLISVQQKR